MSNNPRVAFHEKLTREITVTHTYRRVINGDQLAAVRIAFKPWPRGAGFVFVDATVNGAVPSAFVAAVEQGLNQQRQSGGLGGFPMVDFQATLLDGAYHEIDSSAAAFEIAARAALRELATKDAVAMVDAPESQ